MGGTLRDEAAPGEAPRWAGETCAIIASGPSASQEKAEACKGLRVITINTSFRLAPWADVFYACDEDWWAVYHEEVMRLPGEPWTLCKVAADRYGVNWIEGVNNPGLSRNPERINTGGNSGYQAINLAYHFGVSRILLIGYDMGGRHWHGRHPAPLRNSSPYGNWIPRFHALAEDLKAEGVDVVNCSPGTALKAFRVSTLEAEL
jgi:hypothetical protein